MTLLESISGPRDLKALSPDELPALASEIRDFLIEAVSRNGGHLGPNLGVVELTIALHRVFDSPADRIVFDTGHQAYVHKMLTGRQAGFATLRQRGGLSGYPSQAESEHDIVENSHASTALSYADGLAKAYQLRGEHDRTVVAVVGDGALTGGMAWEALNNIAARQGPPAGHRGQRQRPLLHADDRRARRAPGRGPGVAALRARAGVHQDLPAARPAGRPARCTRRCTASRRASRTCCSRRCCSRTSASSTSARSTATTSSWSSTRCAAPAGSAAR